MEQKLCVTIHFPSCIECTLPEAQQMKPMLLLDRAVLSQEHLNYATTAHCGLSASQESKELKNGVKEPCSETAQWLPFARGWVYPLGQIRPPLHPYQRNTHTFSTH